MPIWKKAPFIRLLLPLITGIIFQWYLQISEWAAWVAFVLALVISITGFFLRDYLRYRLTMINGTAVIVIFLSLGCLLTSFKDIRNDEKWFGKNYEASDAVKIILQEPLIEKTHSQKATASVVALRKSNGVVSACGKIVVYFKKDSLPLLDYGSQIVILKSLQEIKNEGNPAGFDYKRYNLFQDITHQVFLNGGDFIVLNNTSENFFEKILFPLRKNILSALRRYIHGEKEYGLAEALLIGYKDDLDKNLVQSYTNTGVVHIIAISGMHIALIYWLLDLLCRPLKKLKYSKWLNSAIIIAGLWLFSLLAGAQASVLRSAVMFTCIVIGKNLSRKSSIYNTLIVSAFLLLCYNPFWLWDVGFQLSYAAVLSIVIFSKPIYKWFYIKNKIVDSIWKLNAVSIAAQILTTPLSIYHFHQFPSFFLLSNFVAVPLSSLIVLGEIFLCAVSPWSFLASLSGKILSALIWLMNSYIERIEALPNSLWDGMQINVPQAALLTIIVCAFGHYLLEKQKTGAWLGLFGLLFFFIIRSISLLQCIRQQKIIVYNIPGHEAIDLVDGRNYFFIGDPDLVSDDVAQNFHLKPSRILYRLNVSRESSQLKRTENFLEFNSKKLLMADQNLLFYAASEKIPIDLLIISKNPKINLINLCKAFEIKQVVFDGSVNIKKLRLWRRDCRSLHLSYYDVNEKGAFVMSFN